MLQEHIGTWYVKRENVIENVEKLEGDVEFRKPNENAEKE